MHCVYTWGFLDASVVKSPLPMQEMQEKYTEIN